MLTGKNATARCAAGCSFFCTMDNGTTKFCGSSTPGHMLSTQYFGLKDGTHTFFLNVTEASGIVAGVHNSIFSVDTIPPSAYVTPLFTKNVIELGGTPTTIYSWPNASAIPFAICLDKPSPVSVTIDMLQVSGGTIVSFEADETVSCPPAQDTAAGIVSADSATAKQNKTQVAISKNVYNGVGKDKLLVVSGGATRYKLLVAPPRVGGTIVQASVRNSTFHDYAGNGNVDLPGAAGLVLFDVKRPTPKFLQLTDGKREITEAVYTFAINFQEQVFNFSANKITCVNCVVTGFAPTYPGMYGIDISISPASTAAVSVPAGAAQDYAGHLSLASSVFKVKRYAVSTGAQAGTAVAMAAGLALVGPALIVPASHVIAVNHPLQVIQRLQAFALTGHFAVNYPASYQSSVSSAQWINFDIKSPIEHSLFGGPRRAADVKGVGQSVGGLPPPSTPTASAAQSHARHLLQSRTGGDAATSGGGGGSSGSASPSAFAPAPSPSASSGEDSSGGDCQGNTGLGANGSCSGLQSLANSQYLAILSPDAFASVASNSVQNNLQDPGANGLRQAARILFYLGAFLAFFMGLQLMWPLVERRWGTSLPTLLSFPTFQVFYFGIALAGVVSLAAELIVGGTAAGISIAVVLLIFYALFVVWCMWKIYHYTIKDSAAKFVVKKARPPKVSFLKRLVGNDYPAAGWQAESEVVLGSYGILFESVKGYKYRAPKVEPPPRPPEDPNTGAYLEARWDVEHYGPGGAPPQTLAPEVDLKLMESVERRKLLRLATWRQMYFILDVTSQIWIALVMGAYPYNSNAAPQVYCIIVLKVIEIGVLGILKPQISPGDFIVLLIGKLCDLGTAVCNFYLLNPNISDSENLNIALALLIFQLTAIAVVVLWFWYVMMRESVVPYFMGLILRKRTAMKETHSESICAASAASLAHPMP